MKGFDLTKGHTFEAPFIAYHVQRAKAGNRESERWLRDNVRAADKDGRPVDLYVRFLVDGGGLRMSRERKRRGQRGKALGEHQQLLLAREMWKQLHLAKDKLLVAERVVGGRFNRSSRSARNAYYKFAKTSDARLRRAFRVELARDYIENRATWEGLARNSDCLTDALSELSSF